MRKKTSKEISKRNFKFIFALTIVGVLLILISLVDNNVLGNTGSSSFSGKATASKESFQPSDKKKNVPGKLIWGRDF